MAATESSSARAAAPLGLASATGGEAAAANLVHMETPKSHHLLSSANTNEPGSLNANTNQSARGAESSVKMRMNCTVSTERDGYSKPKASASGANANANGTPNIKPAPIIDPSNQSKLIDPLAPTGTGVVSMDIRAKSLVTAKPTSPAVASGPSKLLDESPTVGKPSARNDSIKVLDSGFEHADVQPRAPSGGSFLGLLHSRDVVFRGYSKWTINNPWRLLGMLQKEPGPSWGSWRWLIGSS